MINNAFAPHTPDAPIDAGLSWQEQVHRRVHRRDASGNSIISERLAAVLIVPTANLVRDSYAALVAALRGRGLRASVVALPSTGAEHPPTAGYDDDVAAVRAAAQLLVDAGQRVVVLMHGYGSVPGSDALHALSRSCVRDRGGPGGVEHIFYLCGYPLAEGSSIETKVEEAGYGEILRGMTHVAADRTRTPRDPVGQLFGGLPEAAQGKEAVLLASFNPTGLAAKARYAAWRDIPATYIYTTKDALMPVALQEAMANNIVSQGATLSELRLEACHAAHVQDPEDVAAGIEIVARRRRSPSS